MARRAQSKVPVVAIILGVLLFAAVAFVGWKVIGGSRQVDYPPLNVADFRNNSRALRDNRYSLEGTVDRRDRVTDDGSLITLVVGEQGEGVPIPVYIPSALKDTNIEAGYQMKFVVRINSDGVPEVEDIRD